MVEEFLNSAPGITPEIEKQMAKALSAAGKMRETNEKLTEQNTELFRQGKVASALIKHYAGVIRTSEEKIEEAEKRARKTLLDEKTGILNGRGFKMALEGIQRESDQKGSLLFVDGDGFKLINDTYGHMAGDEVIKAIAKYLTENTRDTDIVARWGGDEFIVYFPGATPNQILEKFKFKTKTEKGKESGITFPLDLEMDKNGKSQLIHLDVETSGGVAEYSMKEETLDKATKKADEALYRAKKAGRGHFSK